MKALYLDFDGVLHDDDVYMSRQRGIYIKTPGRALFEWMPILEELLTPHPDVRIVLSTSWVRVKSFEFAKSHLSPALQERVIGATYHRRFMRREWFESLPRGEQVMRDVVRRNPTSWLALDNETDGPALYRQHLVKTEDHAGLSCSTVQVMLRERLAQM